MGAGSLAPKQISIRESLNELGVIVSYISDHLAAHALEDEGKTPQGNTVDDIQSTVSSLIRRMAAIRTAVLGL